MKLGGSLRTFGATLGLLSLVACAGKSCSCVQPIKGGFPVAQRHDNMIQVRATQSFFTFLSANGVGLVDQVLGGNGTINIPPSCGSTPICCATPAPMCRLSVMPKSLSLQPKAPNAVHLALATQLKTLDPLPTKLLGTDCTVTIDTTSNPNGITLSGDLQLSVDATTDTTKVAVQNSGITGMTGTMVHITGHDLLSDGVCGAVGLFNDVFNLLPGIIAGQLPSLVNGQLCMKCSTKGDCNSFASACTNSTCVGADGTTCIQELGLEGRLDLASLLAKFAPGLRATMDIYAVAGGYAAADTGLSLGLLGGALSDPHSACVPMVAPPVPPAIAQSRTFYSDVLPDGATPYHIGIGIHKSFLDTAAWAAFDAGGLCLHIGTPSVALISSKTIGLVMPSLKDLVHVGDAPMFIALRPQTPPTFTLGKGTFKTDMNGQRVIDDPLLHVSAPGFDIDFYAWIEDRYVRVLTLNSDLDLGVSLDVDGMGRLLPVLGDTGGAFTNLHITNSALLTEPPQKLAKAFPMLLSVALGSLTSSLGPITLPAVAGLNLKAAAATSTDPDANGVNQFLSIFADATAATTAAERLIDTQATLESVALPPTSEFAVTGRADRQPTVYLRLDSPSGGELEFSWSVDEGGWSPFSRVTRAQVTDARFWMQGRHTIDVRARLVGHPASVDATPARVEVLIDTVAPAGELEIAGGELRASASDLVSPPSALQYRFAFAGGGWTPWSSSDRLAVPAGELASSAQAQARDEAGNVGDLAFHGRSTTPSPAGCGCQVGAGNDDAASATLGWVLAAIVGSLVIARRRRRAWAPLAGVACLLLATGGCSSGGLGKGDYESPLDQIGRYSDVVYRGGFHLSAYDDTFGDLVYAFVSDPAKPIGWQVIDGIDPTAMVSDKNGYRHGVLDFGPDVGLYTSIAVSSSGNPVIAYYDATNGALKLARGPHPFSVHTVEMAGAGQDVGKFSAISLDGHDVPQVAYLATGISDGTTFHSELRLASAKSATPSSSADWNITVVDKTQISCAGRCAQGSACIKMAMNNGMPNGDPSLSSCITIDANPCKATCTMTQACISGACTDVLQEQKAKDLPEGIGLFTQARRTSTGVLELIYYSRNQGSLKLAVQQGDGSFKTSFVDGNSMTADVGQYCSAGIAADDTLHVVYQDALADQLLYKKVAGGTPDATATVVDDGLRAGGPHSVGAAANLALDSAGGLRVIYQDQTTASLQKATGPSWMHSEIETGTPGYGFYPHQVTADGMVYLTEFVYDRGNADPAPFGQLHIIPLP
jgi:MYXO-CTERM domain-containing protein